jgi:hypothetical protein
MPPAHRHHFISQFYLRNFVADRTAPQLFVVDLQEGRSFVTSTANVALENDFHTISAPGQRPDMIERQLSKFEAAVAPALARLIQRASVGEDENAQLVLFFATLLLVKNPGMRGTVSSFVDTLMKRMSQMEAADPEAWNARMRQMVDDGVFPPDSDEEDLRQSILRGDFSIDLSPEAHMTYEFSSAAALVELVARRHWNVYRAKEGQFVTCDRPVVLMWSDPMQTDAIGLALPNTRVLFPLSGEIALCGGFELADEIVPLDAEEVAKVNGRIILNAKRWVYARDDTFGYLLQHNAALRRGSDLPEDRLVTERR